MMPQFGKQSTDAKKRLQHQLYLVCIWILEALFSSMHRFFV